MTPLPLEPVNKGGFSWACPRCGRPLPDSTKSVATEILNTKHLVRCPKKESKA